MLEASAKHGLFCGFEDKLWVWDKMEVKTWADFGSLSQRALFRKMELVPQKRLVFHKNMLNKVFDFLNVNGLFYSFPSWDLFYYFPSWVLFPCSLNTGCSQESQAGVCQRRSVGSDEAGSWAHEHTRDFLGGFMLASFSIILPFQYFRPPPKLYKNTNIANPRSKHTQAFLDDGQAGFQHRQLLRSNEASSREEDLPQHYRLKSLPLGLQPQQFGRS